MKTCVLIPAYNESEKIGGIIAQILRFGIEVVVVDDGSKDNTAQIARQHGAVVLSEPLNHGKGAALIKGFDYVLGHDFDAVITMDGDGQHDPEDIPYFIRSAESSDSGVIIGNRMGEAAGMPISRLYTNKFMSRLISCIVAQKIPDTQCGFRLIKKEVLRAIKLRCCNYEIESEVILKAARQGLKVASVPIRTMYNQERSRINPLIDTFRFIGFIFYELWTMRS